MGEGALVGFFALRFGLTMVSYGSGAPGGIFAPLLVLGSELGLALGLLSRWVLPGAIDHPETFTVAGMAAYFTAIVRAPLTGIVLIVEMTGDYSLVLPLLVACLTAYCVADYLGGRPVYEALLERASCAATRARRCRARCCSPRPVSPQKYSAKVTRSRQCGSRW